MNDRQTIEILLETQKEYINKLLRRIKQNQGEFEETTSIEDIQRILWFGFPHYYERETLHKLNELNEKLTNLKFTCRFSEETERGIKYMIAPSATRSYDETRQAGLKEIRDFTYEAEDLIIIDPYFFGGSTAEAEDYVQEFKRSSRIDKKQLKEVHIIYSSAHGNTPAIKTKMKKVARENGCTISSFDTDKVHDRIWIKNKAEAIVIGTSFGGIGNRLCFILQLPEYDLKTLMEYLQEQKMITHTFG